MISNVGANTFLIFMGFDICSAIFCFFLVKETRGQNLEIAAGTEWEIAEKAAVLSDTEKGDVDTETGHTTEPGILHINQNNGGQTLVDDHTGKQLDVVAVHDSFGTSLKHRS